MAGRSKSRSKFRPINISDYEKMVNMLMIGGNKTASRKIVDMALKYMGEKLADLNKDLAGSNDENKAKFANSREVLTKALQMIAPVMETRSKRIGGSVYPIPMEVGEKRRMALAMRWVRDVVRKSKGTASYLPLAMELMSAVKGEGASMKKREEVHKQADAAKAFAHFK